jgi:transcription-repair coupling factor (superfamily II helicase)
MPYHHETIVDIASIVHSAIDSANTEYTIDLEKLLSSAEQKSPEEINQQATNLLKEILQLRQKRNKTIQEAYKRAEQEKETFIKSLPQQEQDEVRAEIEVLMMM